MPEKIIIHLTKLLLIVILLFFSWPNLKAQENYYFRHLSTGDGLSQSSVISIAQDHNGLLWFATRDGFNSYDGNEFSVYRNNPADSNTISNNDVLKILIDSAGNIWAGTYNGLNKFDYETGVFHRYYNDKGDKNSLSNNIIWSLCETINGDLWIGTSDGLNVLRDGVFHRVYHDPATSASLSNNYILDIFQDSRGQIWVGTTNGLNQLLSSSNNQFEFKRYLFSDNKNQKTNSNFCQAIAEDSMGNLWVGTKAGIYKRNAKNQTWINYKNQQNDPGSLSNDDVRSLSFDKDNTLWTGTYNGLNKMVGSDKFIQIYSDPSNLRSLTKNTIKTTFVDNNGSLWIGIYYGGVNMLNPANSNFVNYKQMPDGQGLNYDVISSIVEDKNGNVYIGTEGGGINILNPKTQTIENNEINFGDNSSYNIKSLYLTQNRFLWIGTYGTGLYIYDITTHELVANYNKDTGLTHNSIYSILQENDSLYWIGTFGGGLNLLNTRANSSTEIVHQSTISHSLSNNQIRSLKKDSKGNLWVATQYGLNKLSAENLKNENYYFDHFFYDETKESGEDILVIYEDSKKQIWVSAYGSGLNLYNPGNNSFTSHQKYIQEEGQSNIIHGILEDSEGFLWLSSNQGIIKYTPFNLNHLIYNESDGLASNEFNNNASYKSNSGRMYFGGPQGLTSFHPSQISANLYAPPTIITDIKLFNQSIKINDNTNILDKAITNTERITLDYDQTIFTIDYAIPNFINPAKNQYSYRLRGLEDNWNTTSKNTATYTFQKPGTYTFEVKGANNDGVWSDEITSLKITVLPAPWRTWWAFLFYFLITLSAVYALSTIIISRSKLRHELEMEHIENERQKSVNKLKLRFFTNISHEFRTPLTLILGPLEQILEDYKGSNKTFKQLKVVEKNAIRLLKLINQLLDFRKFENKHEKLKAAEGNIVKFVEEIFLSFKQYAKLHNLEYTFKKSEDKISLWYDRDKMERVFYNLISNAFKYTPKGGNIEINVWKDDESFHCEVKDTGVGLEREHLDSIFDRFYEVENVESAHKHQKGTGIGLAIAKGVVKMHSGSIMVESTKNVGTSFKVSIPLGNTHLSENQIIQDFKDSEDVTNYLAENIEPIDSFFEDIESQSIDLDISQGNEPVILVVEDNASVRKFIADIFIGDYKIIEAHNGLAGLKIAQQNLPDLIISDVMMPEMDGIEFCARIKSNVKTSHIPFILLTARTSLIFKFEGLESGADEYISKPFNVKELSLKVRNLIKTFSKIREKFAEASIIKPSEITVSSLDEELLKNAIKIVDENISNEFLDVPLFASELGVSRTVLFAKIKAWTNMTPSAFIQSMRMKRAAQLLEQDKITVSQICFKVGYKDPKYFSKAFTKHHGMSPTGYAKKFTSAG